MSLTVETVCGSIVRGRLMSPDELAAVQERWRSEAGGGAGQLAAFLKWLVGRGHITEYQANLLAKGHSEGFFLGQYKILERIGRGRMAGVYKATHALGQVVAIKVLPPSRAKHPQLLGRFQREARLSLRLRHPSIVRSFQVGSADGLHYLVMEHLEGETLDELIKRRKRLPSEEAVRLVHQVLLGLQHVHEQGMIHRDIKPANLMLVPPPTEGDAFSTLRSTVKILDIGLAREFFEEARPEKPGDAELTAEGVLLGTPDYLAPEQARDARSIDIRADIYSAGCVLYHLLSGQPPFPDKNIFNQMYRHATEAPRPLKEFNPAIPEGLEQIVHWMMAKDPNQRYPTPARAAQALEVFLIVGTEPAPAAVDEAPQMRRFLTWLETEDEGTAGTHAESPTPAPPPAPPSSPVPVARSTSDVAAAPGKPLTAPPAPPAPTVKKAKAATEPAPAPRVGKPAEPVVTKAVTRDDGRTMLSRRDYLMMGLGAGVVILLFGFVGCLMTIFSMTIFSSIYTTE